MRSTRNPVRRNVLLTSIMFVLTLSLAYSCGKKNSEDSLTDASFDNGPQPQKNFAYLINNFAQSKAVPTPWAGYWWPYSENGIASGKNGGGKSPAGKYDAARGGTTNAQGWEIANHGTKDPKMESWWGHCNGWCAAAALFPEPRTPVTVNGITFDIGDQKALLTEAGMEASSDFFGNRVDFGQDYDSPKFWDTVPNQFFLVLTNYMGRFNRSVLIDRFTGDQVWNQPLAGYRFDYPKPEDYLGPSPEAPNVYRILLTSTIWWSRDDVPPDVLTPDFEYDDGTMFESRALRLEVWVDGPVVFGADGRVVSSGNVVASRNGEYIAGGAWRNGEGYYYDGHPDYMWIPYSLLKPTDNANPQVDINWIREHILSGGVDDPSVTPTAIPPAPSPEPRRSVTPSVLPSWPTTRPSVWPHFWPIAEPNESPLDDVTPGDVTEDMPIEEPEITWPEPPHTPDPIDVPEWPDFPLPLEPEPTETPES